MLEQSRFEEKLEQADLLLTGEGRFDGSSLKGKLIGKLCELAERKKKPVVAFCGSVEVTENRVLPRSLEAIRDISANEDRLSEALKKTQFNLQRAVHAYFRE